MPVFAEPGLIFGWMVPERVRLGELLVDAQIISRSQLEKILLAQKQDGRRIGTLLVEAQLVTETQVTQILSQQLSVPWVSLYHIDFSRQLLNLVARDLAEKYGLVPIFVRRVRNVGETLYVAMDDPSDEEALAEVAKFAGLPVRAMIAPPTDIQNAIRVYYGVGKDTASLSEAVAELDAEASAGARSPDREKAPLEVHDPDELPGSDRTPIPGAMHVLLPREVPSLAALEARASEKLKAAPAIESPRQDRPEVELAAEPVTQRTSLAPESGPQIEYEEISLPLPRKRGVKMITLTLLDGSTVNLPARESAARETGSERSPAPADANGGELTARDLVTALRAVVQGTETQAVLGNDVRWEAMFAALLSVLLKKHLIADWEFVEEYKKS
jgi:type IV pilus assembly protein PilB